VNPRNSGQNASGASRVINLKRVRRFS
jgi:hypothetical protein